MQAESKDSVLDGKLFVLVEQEDEKSDESILGISLDQEALKKQLVDLKVKRALLEMGVNDVTVKAKSDTITRYQIKQKKIVDA